MNPINRKPPTPKSNTEGMQDAGRIQRWRRLLDQNIPLIGGWMHRRITTALTDSALTGNWLAAQNLAIVYVAHQDEEVRQLAGLTLKKLNYSTGIDAVWGVWAETRHPGLEQIATSYQRIAAQPASVRLLSALRMNSLDTVTHGGAELIPPLLKAWDDPDPQIAEGARQAMRTLHSQSSIDALCSAWRDNRYPFLDDIIDEAGYVAQKPPAVRVLTALRANRLDIITNAAPDMISPLIDACKYNDPFISKRARSSLAQLKNQAAVDEFCKQWSETRSPFLENILIKTAYKARSPIEIRILVALKTGNLPLAEKIEPRSLSHLFEAANDVDQEIRENANIVFGNLSNPETQDALCRMVIEKDDPRAKEIALTHGYSPNAPEDRALFLFLTEQWAAYEALDFDQGMMRTIYEASLPAIRKRIAAGVQAAGRTEYLTILVGVDFRLRAPQVNPDEAALMVRVLTNNKEYNRLWELVTEFPLSNSVDILQFLISADWSPEDEMDLPVFEQLKAILKEPILLSGPELKRVLPIAIPRETLKVKGRINDVAFSPNSPVIAIATSQRKVVLWNFQTASIERILEGFNHSVGKVCYTPQGVLVASERSSVQADCSVVIFDGEQAVRLGKHLGTVTAIEPVGNTNLLTAGRDSKIILWDLLSRQVVKTSNTQYWARSVAISPDQQYAALLHDRLSLVRLPELTPVSGYAFLPPRSGGFKLGVAHHAAFSADGKYLFAGQYNGQVGMYYHTSVIQHPKKVLVTQHSQPVRGLRFLAEHSLLVSAAADGQIRFFNWPDLTIQGTVYSPEGRLTSLQTSPKAAFMATGTNEASLVLWDMRVQDIPALFTLPLASANHEQISNALALCEYRSLNDPIRNALRLIKVLLQHRFRFDIHIDEAPGIRYGEFDIILEEE